MTHNYDADVFDYDHLTDADVKEFIQDLSEYRGFATFVVTPTELLDANRESDGTIDPNDEAALRESEWRWMLLSDLPTDNEELSDVLLVLGQSILQGIDPGETVLRFLAAMTNNRGNA
jgi:hypothetical protein